MFATTSGGSTGAEENSSDGVTEISSGGNVPSIADAIANVLGEVAIDKRPLKRGIETPEGRRWVVAVCGPIPIANVELGPDFLLTGNPKGADFALMLGEFYCTELDAPELVKIEREGVVFARVYDIRGRSVKDLNTIPPVINNSN